MLIVSGENLFLSCFQGLHCLAATFTLLTELTVGIVCSGMKAELKQTGSEYLLQSIRIKNKIKLNNEFSSVLHIDGT